jgi:hypothetical protein
MKLPFSKGTQGTDATSSRMKSVNECLGVISSEKLAALP